MAPAPHLLARVFQGAARGFGETTGGRSGRLRLVENAEFFAAAKLRDPKLDDFDHISHPLAVGILVLFQRGGIESDVEQRRNAIFSHGFDAESPNTIE